MLTQPTQTTLAGPAELSGIGLHGGAIARVRVLPAPADHGRVFYRADLPDTPAIPARYDSVVDTRLATTLGAHVAGRDVRVSTVEHLLAAMVGLRIDNARVEVFGPELPIVDGSSAAWLELLIKAGQVDQAAPAQRLIVRRPVEISDGERWGRLSPAPGLRIAATIDFPHPMIGRQSLALPLENGEFGRELAWARTFAFLDQVEAVRAAGLGRGGSLENTIIFDGEGVVNPGGLRAPDEAVRHKVLDLVGDLGLIGARLVGQLETRRPGHCFTIALLRALLADPDAYELSS